MMRKKQEYYPDLFWAEYFDFEIESLIYRYLCGKLKKREIKKLKQELRFCRYESWKRYVWRKFEGLKKEQLKEFSRYLNNKSRVAVHIKDYLFIILLPFLITGGAEITNQYLGNIIQLPIDFSELFITASRIEPLIWKLLGFLVAFLLSAVALAFFLLVPLTILGVLLDMRKTMYEVEQQRAFIEDYREIIQQLIDSKE